MIPFFVRSIPKAWESARHTNAFQSGQGKASLVSLVIAILWCPVSLLMTLSGTKPLSHFDHFFVCVVPMFAVFLTSWCLIMLFSTLGMGALSEWREWSHAYHASPPADCAWIRWDLWAKFFFFGLFFGAFWIVGFVICWVVWAILMFAFKYLWVGAWMFLKVMYALTVSDERILAGLCSALGTAVTYLYFRPNNATVGQTLFLVCVGAIVSMAIGRFFASFLSVKTRSPKTT